MFLFIFHDNRLDVICIRRHGVYPYCGQEKINAASLLEEGVAVSPTDVVTLPYKVDLLLREPQRLAGMRDRMKQLAQPRAAYTVLETLLRTPSGIR